MSRDPRILLALLVAVFMAGCQAPPLKDDTLKDISSTLQEAAKPAPPPAQVANALLPGGPTAAPAARAARAEPRFDINVAAAPAREFFMGLVAGTNHNMVVHPEVRGEVSLALKSVTIPEVLDTVRSVYGYEFERTASGWHVLPVRLQSRIFQVSYLNFTRSGQSETRVSSGEITQSGATGTTAAGTTAVQSSRVQTQTQSDFWAELRTAVTAIVGTAEGRSVIVNPQTGVLLVRAMPGELREVEQFLKVTQKSLTQQVILEAKILEVELSDQFQSGINWATVFSPGSNKSVLAGQTGGGSSFGNLSGSGFLGGNLATPNNPVTGGDFSLPGGAAGAPAALFSALGTTTFGGVFSLALNLNDFAAFISLLEGQGTVQVLSSPRVSALNNQKAVIKVGADQYFITQVDVAAGTTTATGATAPTVDVNFSPFFSGITLDVTPQIDEAGLLTLHVHPKISEVAADPRNIPVGTPTGVATTQIDMARSTVRESDTVVRARSGQIIVIGGLMENKYRGDQAAPPGLTGSLLGHTQRNAVKSELVILLKPVVAANDDVWRDSISASEQRIQGLRPATPAP
jgi:MSHA biogenesis protein MshL